MTIQTQNIPPRKKAENFKSVKDIEPRSETQSKYLEAIDNHIVTFGIGPAGTGKTYLAMYQAICHLWNRKHTGINRIILTRPVVEAGERLGFLPGAIEDKMDPFMRPLYDSLYDIVGIEVGREKLEKGFIEIAPIAFMRGRTFNDAFIIIDEAQNCTFQQLKMALTRLGENVKCIVSGDVGQSDLNGKSGLGKIAEALQGTENVKVVKFTNEDVVRSKVARDILTSISGFENGRQGHAQDAAEGGKAPGRAAKEG